MIEKCPNLWNSNELAGGEYTEESVMNVNIIEISIKKIKKILF
jgi:hypothetical protein